MHETKHVKFILDTSLFEWLIRTYWILYFTVTLRLWNRVYLHVSLKTFFLSSAHSFLWINNTPVFNECVPSFASMTWQRVQNWSIFLCRIFQQRFRQNLAAKSPFWAKRTTIAEKGKPTFIGNCLLILLAFICDFSNPACMEEIIRCEKDTHSNSSFAMITVWFFSRSTWTPLTLKTAIRPKFSWSLSHLFENKEYLDQNWDICFLTKKPLESYRSNKWFYLLKIIDITCISRLMTE